MVKRQTQIKLSNNVKDDIDKILHIFGEITLEKLVYHLIKTKFKKPVNNEQTRNSMCSYIDKIEEELKNRGYIVELKDVTFTV